PPVDVNVFENEITHPEMRLREINLRFAVQLFLDLFEYKRQYKDRNWNGHVFFVFLEHLHIGEHQTCGAEWNRLSCSASVFQKGHTGSGPNQWHASSSTIWLPVVIHSHMPWWWR